MKKNTIAKAATPATNSDVAGRRRSIPDPDSSASANKISKFMFTLLLLYQEE